MTKRTLILGLCLASLALVATGCDLYVDDDNDYYYCDDTGCYYCDDWGCYPDGGAPPGWECTDNDDCAAGCYCTGSGYCEEAGFCESDSDCPVGFTCDDRDSCIPEDGGGPRGCTTDDQCPGEYVCNQSNGLCEEFSCSSDGDCEAGSYCDEDSGDCVESGSCSSPGQDTCASGFECDVSRQSCMPDDGVCLSDPECGDGNKCDDTTQECVPLECSDYTDYDSCQGATGCVAALNLTNCTDTGGGTCSISTPQFCECSNAAFLGCFDE